MNGTVLLGLDGATWKLLKPFAEKGIMPALNKLMKRSAWGVLKSTIPPVTGAAWLSIATGYNPGKTGVIDFFTREDTSYRLRLVTSKDYNGKAYWDLLSATGRSAAIAFYPMLYPPYPIKGYMISGFGSPIDGIAAWPPQIADRLQALVPDFKTTVDYHDPIYNNIDLFIDHVTKHLEQLKRIINNYILANATQDNITVVVSATDWIQHRLWHLLDTSHPLHNPLEAANYRHRIEELYYLIDEIIAATAEFAHSEERHLIIVSDHGFGPNTGVFNLTQWLLKKGYMKLKKHKTIKPKILETFKKLAIKLHLAKILRKTLPQTVKRKLVHNIDFSEIIDLDTSRAVTLGHTIVFGGIYITASNKEEIIEKILSDLRKIPEEIGAEVEVKMWKREDIYQGERLDILPDIILTIDDFAFSIPENLHDPLYRPGPWSPRHTGSHRLEGIILINGSTTKQTENITTSIYNVMPTLLYLHNLPIPDDVDGKPLTKILNKKEEPKYVKRNYYNIRIKLQRKLYQNKIN